MAVVAAVLLALTSTTQSVYMLTAATYILPGIFGYPFNDQADISLATPYIDSPQTTGAPPPSALIVLNPPAVPPAPDSIQPGSVVFGYSQGADTATTYKQSFNQLWASNAAGAPTIAFVLLGNPDRPNGGTFARQNLGATPTETAGAASGDITTYDIARQYDATADSPTNPLNLLAVANASIGFFLAHTDYFSVNMSDAVLQGTYGDTAYYLVPTYPLPLLMPLEVIPLAGPVLADMLDPTLRVLVEAGYDRTINPGVPTPFNPNYFPDPTALANNFDLAFSTGLDNGLEDVGQGRPFGTVRPGPYGVGGPPVTVATASTQQPATPTPSLSGTLSDPSSLPSPTMLTTALAPFSQPASTPPTSTLAPLPTTMSPVAPAAPMSGPESAGSTANANSGADVTVSPSITTAPEEPSIPSAHDGTKPVRPTIRGPIGFEPPDVKHPAPSVKAPWLKPVFGGPLGTARGNAAAQGGGTGQGGPNRGEGGGSSPQ